MFQPIDVQRATGVSKTTALRIENDLGMVPKRTEAGYRIYTRSQAKRLVEEIRRRQADRAAELAGVIG